MFCPPAVCRGLSLPHCSLASLSEGSSWGTWSLCGRVGSRSLVGRPRTHIAGDILVSGLGALRYVSRALKKEELRVPPGPVLPAIRRLTAVSAL